MGELTLSPRVTVIFDGTCGFCTRQVRFLHKLDRHHRLASKPCQHVKHDPTYGLENVDCGAMAWAISDDGRREAGAQAFTLVASVLLDSQWPLRIGRFPGIRQALALGYWIIARNRYRFPGDVPPISDGSCRADADERPRGS
jgi:predicted DCC family thiol-disulfide oxidoreductase YuxK